MMVNYEVISDQEWAQIPPKPPKAPSEWEPVLDELEAGKAIRLRATDPSKLRGMRLALGRRAAGRGFKVEIRSIEDGLAARRSDMPYTPPEPKPRTPRRRKGQEEPATVDPAQVG